MQFDCPVADTLPDIPVADCPFKIGQIVRFAAQLRQLGVEPFSEAVAGQSIKKKASWTTMVNADDATKIVFSPIFAGFTVPSSEEKVEGGGDNSTPFGQEEYVGENPVKVPFVLSNTHPLVVNALRKLTQQSIPLVGTYRLTLYWFNEYGQIVCIQTGEAATIKNSGIPAYNFRVGSRGSEGYNAKDKIPCGFGMPADWDTNVAIVTPTDFNPLTDF